jgi:hypothetical protein
MPMLSRRSRRGWIGLTQPCFEALLDHAVAFAQPVLRTDAAADFGEVVGRRREFVGFVEPALGGELQPVRDVVGKRAMHLAERHATLAAAARLGGGLGRGETLVDLVEIEAAHGDVPLVGGLLGELDEFEHALGHGRSPCEERTMLRQDRPRSIAERRAGGESFWINRTGKLPI